MDLNPNEKLFLNYNYVKGAQNFLKEAGLVSYEKEGMEEMDANAVAQAMLEEGVEVPAEEAMADNAILEVANTLVELAQGEDPATAAKLESAAEDVAEAAAAPAPEDAPVEASAPVAEEKMDVMSKEKEAAKKVAESLKAAGDSETNPKPDQVLSISDTDYEKGMGQTTLKTEKGEVGAQDNVESQVVEQKVEEAGEHMVTEGKDIHGKDYEKGMGQTTLKTEKGEVGAEENVEAKVDPKMAEEKKEASETVEKDLAVLSMQRTLAKVLGK